MNRAEFIAQLERLLVDIPESDRNDAIAYYDDYFDEAGVENEANIIQELGSPGKVAAIIKADMGMASGRGEFTEHGYQDARFKERIQAPVKKFEERTDRRGAGRWALIIVVLVFASPVVLGLGGGLFGGAFGILGAIAGIGIGVLTGGIGLLIAGITGVVVGIIECFANPASGLVMMGSGMLSTAVSLLMMALFIKLVFRVLPKLFRACVNFISRIIHRGKGGKEE